MDTFRSVEASLRVDALASAGFRISRSKLVALIRCVIGLCFQQSGQSFCFFVTSLIFLDFISPIEFQCYHWHELLRAYNL